MSDKTPEKNTEENHTKCKLFVVFESYGKKKHEETYPLDFSVEEWIHVQKDKEMFSHLETFCSDNQTQFTKGSTAPEVIGLLCQNSNCISPGVRLTYSRSLQKAFNNIAANLAVIEHSLPERDLDSVFTEVSESSVVSSGDATVVKSNGRIVVVTGKQHTAYVEQEIGKVISKRRESGYTSFEPRFRKCHHLNDIEANFFKSVQTRDYIISKLLEHGILGNLCIDGDNHMIVCSAETKETLAKANIIYNSSIIKKRWGVKDVVIPEEIVRAWKEHLKNIFAGKACCMRGTDTDIVTVATEDVQKDVEAYMEQEWTTIKRTHKKKLSYSSSLVFTFQGLKRRLLKERPQSRVYLTQCVANSDVRFEADELSGEFRLVTSEEHKEKAIKVLSCIQTKDIQIIDQRTVQAISKELMKRDADIMDRMLLDLDESTSMLSVTATADVFDRVLWHLDQVLQENVMSECYHVPRTVMKVALTECRQEIQGFEKEHDIQLVPERDTFIITGNRFKVERAKTFLNSIEQKIKQNHSALRRSFTEEKLPVNDGEDYSDWEESITLSKEGTKKLWLYPSLLSVWTEKFQQKKVKIVRTRSRLVLTGTKAGVSACIEEITRTCDLTEHSPSGETVGSETPPSEKDLIYPRTPRSDRMSSLLSTPEAETDCRLSMENVTNDCGKSEGSCCGKTVNDEYLRRENAGDLISSRTPLSSHVSSLLSSSSSRTFVRKVCNHLSIEAEFTSVCSHISFSKNTNAVSLGRRAVQPKKKFALRDSSMTAKAMRNILEEEEPGLADRLLIHIDNESGKMVVFGSSSDVDSFIQKKMSFCN